MKVMTRVVIVTFHGNQNFHLFHSFSSAPLPSTQNRMLKHNLYAFKEFYSDINVLLTEQQHIMIHSERNCRSYMYEGWRGLEKKNERKIVRNVEKKLISAAWARTYVYTCLLFVEELKKLRMKNFITHSYCGIKYTWNSFSVCFLWVLCVIIA